jgi:hypothetical protein
LRAEESYNNIKNQGTNNMEKSYDAAYSIKVKNIKKLNPTQKKVDTSLAILTSFMSEANKNA